MMAVDTGFMTPGEHAYYAILIVTHWVQAAAPFERESCGDAGVSSLFSPCTNGYASLLAGFSEVHGELHQRTVLLALQQRVIGITLKLDTLEAGNRNTRIGIGIDMCQSMHFVLREPDLACR